MVEVNSIVSIDGVLYEVAEIIAFKDVQPYIRLKGVDKLYREYELKQVELKQGDVLVVDGEEKTVAEKLVYPNGTSLRFSGNPEYVRFDSLGDVSLKKEGGKKKLQVIPEPYPADLYEAIGEVLDGIELFEEALDCVVQGLVELNQIPEYEDYELDWGRWTTLINKYDAEIKRQMGEADE